MKLYITAILLLFTGHALYAQNVKSYVHQGNELYDQKKYKDAEADYRKAIAEKEKNVAGNFNLGDALYKEKKFDDAAKDFNSLASANTNPAIKAGALHNLGNTMLQSKKYQESIDAYEKSLLNNPKDDQTRYNLAYAQEMLKKQQQQNKQNQKNNQNNQQNKDRNKSDQDKKNQDKQNQDKKNQDKKDQDKQNQQQQQNNVSKDDAQRMLDAMNDQEKATQDKLKNKKLKGGKMHIDKDW